MKSTPIVSVITPSYNSSRFIRDTLESVLEQTYTDWEMIVVDDASTDNSCEIIKEYCAKDNRIKMIALKKRLGVSGARNHATKKTIGRYIAFLDSDDIWLHNKLERQVALMQKTLTLMSYSSYFTINENGTITGVFSAQKQVTYQDMLKTSAIGTLTMMYDTKALGKLYFMNIGQEDYILKLEILKESHHAIGLSEPLAKYRISRNSLSSNKIKSAKWQWQVYRNIEKLSLSKSIYYFFHYFYHGVTKYKKIRT